MQRILPSLKAFLLVVSLIALGLDAPSHVHAQESEAPAPKPEAPPADQELLDALGEDLDGALEDALFEGLDAPGEMPAGEGETHPPIDRELLEELGEGGEDAAESDDPLARLGQQMRRVEDLLRGGRSDQPTQQLQEQIVSGLDQLIRKARQQQSSSSSSPSASQNASRRSEVKQPSAQPGGQGEGSNQPATESTSRVGSEKAQRPDGDEMQAILKELWGHLPPHEREQMINATLERFLPKYEVLIEAYFQRLVEDRPD